MKFVPLGSIADIQLGKMLSPKAKTGEGSFPYLRNQDVQWGRIKLNDLPVMDFSDRERQKFELRVGDLLVCEGGEPGRCAVWFDERTDCYYQKALHRIRPHVGIADAEFLSYWIRYQAFTGAFEDQNAKTTIAHLPLVRLEQMLVPALAVDEQRRIAARLKAQLAAVEEARKAAQAQLLDCKRLIPSILETAFAETADAELVRIGDFAKTTSGTTPSRGRKDYWEPPKFPWVKTGEVTFAPIRCTEEYVSERAFAECSLPLLPPGTVLIAMYGQGKTRGQSAILEIEATTNQACFAILPNETFDPEYSQLWLRLSYEAMRARSEARGGNQSNLNGEMLNGLEVPLIPRKRQQAIAKAIKSSLDEAERLKSALSKQMNDIDKISGRLLAQAFNEV